VKNSPKERLAFRDILTHAAIVSGGTLELRKTGKGVVLFYWRITYEGKGSRHQIGPYDSSAPPKSLSPTKQGYSLSAARSAAEQMAAKHLQARDEGGYQAVVAQEQAEKQAQKEHEAAAGYTLDKLYEMYTHGYLRKRNKKRSAQDAENMFKNHVRTAFPKIANTTANKVSVEQISSILRPLIDAGKKNTARKLRVCLHAAYDMAKNSEQNADVPPELAKFKIKTNPVHDVKSVKQARGVDKKPLMPETMKTYWKLIDVPGKKAALLRLHLMLGGQRPEQFVRMRVDDVHADMIMLLDLKGRTGTERPIYIPRTPVVDEALQAFTPSGGYVLSVKKGKHISTSALAKWAKEIVGKQIPGFTMKRVRSGVATLMAKLQISKEIRNKLQSHGERDIDDIHYNAYDSFEEKKAALLKMHQWLSA